MKDRIAIRIEDGVADVELIREEKMNALDKAMFSALVEAGRQLATTRGLRAVVLSGRGRAFCAGLDFSSFGAMGSTPSDEAKSEVPAGGRLEKRTNGIANHPQYAAWVWRELPVPVIAAVHGVAFGGGLQVMLGADFRYAAPGTRFSIMEIKWGLVPDMSGTATLRGLLRDDVLRELTYTGRIVEAEEALSLGLVTRVCENPRKVALETAREIAGKSPDAIRAAKRLLDALPDATTAGTLLEESREQQRLLGSANQIEAVRANLEKRAPRFSD